MANLTFNKIEHSGRVDGGRVAVGGDETLWYGDSMTVNFQDIRSLRVTSFEEGVEEVLVVLKDNSGFPAGVMNGDILARLTPESPTLDKIIVGDGLMVMTANVYLAVNNNCRGKSIAYEISSKALSAHCPAQGGSTLEIGGAIHAVDSVTNETPIRLEKGDRIVLVDGDAGGRTTYLAISPSSIFTGSATLVRMSSSGYTAEAEGGEFVKIVAGEQYSDFSCTYRIDRHHETRNDSVVAGTQIAYAAPSSAYELEVGDEIHNTTEGQVLIVLDSVNNKILKRLSQGERYSCSYPCSVVLCGEDADTELSYVLQRREEEYAAIYSGGSGILQLRHSMGARVKVYGDAGAGYMLIHEMEGKEIVRAVNMDGFIYLRFVSDGPVDKCIINEF